MQFFKQNWSIRLIAKELGISRKAAARHIRLGQQAPKGCQGAHRLRGHFIGVPGDISYKITREGLLMPLRDHFRPPLDDETSWEGLHGQWPAMIVMALSRKLPPRYVAAPRIQDEYEVRVYDTKRHRRLVAAVELVSPANKDRPETRRAFVAKCAALLLQRVSVAMVDLVTTRKFNLYSDLLDLIGQNDPSLAPEPPPLYAAACRWMPQNGASLLDAWNSTLILGQPLPTLPLWLADNFAVPLELEATYEETCRILRVP